MIAITTATGLSFAYLMLPFLGLGTLGVGSVSTLTVTELAVVHAHVYNQMSTREVSKGTPATTHARDGERRRDGMHTVAV